MNISYRDNAVVCTITTNVIATNIKQLVEEMKTALDALKDYSELVIDLAQAGSIDSLGVTFLIGTYKEAIAQGKKVKLTGVSSAMFQLFKMMKLDEIFEIITA
ncbi:MAG TPA: STAS domain-containing protein [Bacillota bacterium]|nr:STAS domain-containing protein [Bacillota bacterium]